MSNTDVIEFDAEDSRMFNGELLEPGVERAENGDGVVVDLSEGLPETDTTALVNAPFDANLAEFLSDDCLNKLAADVEDYVNTDKRSRQEWERVQRQGMDLLGLRYTHRTDPWEGACGAFHPMLLESVLSFQTQTMSEVVPPKGPAKYEIVGRTTEAKERQGKRVTRDLNYVTMKKIPGYKDETKQLFFKVPIAGTIYRKIWYDPTRRLPRVKNILPENFLMPYGANNLETTPRYTLIEPMSIKDVEKLQAVGFYRDVELGDPNDIEISDLQDERDYIQGESHGGGDPTERCLYECYAQQCIEDLPEAQDGIARPYIITIDETSSKVLAVRRNWREDDPTFEALLWGAKYTYMPGESFFGTGLLQILGGLSESATSILRQLIDAGSLANLPAGFKAKGLRMKGDSDPLMPGEWRDVEVLGGALRDNFMQLPYKEPSATLHALLQNVVDEGRRLGATADAKISDIGSQQMPVGTALAILESVTKVMSGVARNMHDGMACELSVLARIVKDFMPAQYPFELDPGEEQANRKQDYDERSVDVLPVSNPNAATMAMRIMKIQAVMQLAAQDPQLYDKPELHRRMLTAMQVDEIDKVLPAANEVQPRDPVTENMDVINMKPVRAGIEQDHEAHIRVHMAAIEDPKINQIMQQNPNTPAILAAAAAHIQEHLAFQYRKEIEKALGTPLPPPDEPLPADVEYQVSQLAAAAADKVLQRSQTETRQEELLEQLQDPIVQQRDRELAIKEQDLQRKERETNRRLDLQEQKQVTDAKSDSMDRQVDIVKTLMDAQVRHDERISSEQIEGVKEGLSVVKEVVKGAQKTTGDKK